MGRKSLDLGFLFSIVSKKTNRRKLSITVPLRRGLLGDQQEQQEVFKDMVYVISKSGKPLMPCKPAKARKLLRDGKAKCVRRTPFTIKLTFNCEEKTQERETINKQKVEGLNGQ